MSLATMQSGMQPGIPPVMERRSRRRSSREDRHPAFSACGQRFGALLVMLCALVLIVIGARFFLAGIASYQAEAFISAWSKTGNEPDPRAWQIAHDGAQRAVDLYPVVNGDYLDRLGRVYSWKQFRQLYGLPAAKDSRHAALQAYRAAVAARPNWPYSWARLAHSKLYLQQFDQEFDQAFTRAAALGPWRVGVNSELAEIGFHAWPRLTIAQREATLELAQRSVAYGRKDAQNIGRIAQASGHLKTLCNILNSEQQGKDLICFR